MKKAILLEIAARWERDAQVHFNGDKWSRVESSEAEELARAVEQGRRECKRECADLIRMLVDVFDE